MSKLALVRELARSKHLEAEILAIQERERARLGRDLHDGLCQHLAGIGLRMDGLTKKLEELGTPAEQVQTAQQIVDLQYAAIQEARDLARGLLPVDMDFGDQPFCEVLKAVASRANLYFGVPCTASCPRSPQLEHTVATHLYRIVQEAVSNAVRHGKAKRIKISFSQRDKRWRLHVVDDGVGIQDQVPTHDGMGLRTMAYRAMQIGGVLKVHRARKSGDRPGTIVCCSFSSVPVD